MTQTPFVIPDTDVADLSPEEIRQEAQELRTVLAVTEADLAARKAWAFANDSEDSDEYSRWYAGCLSFRARLVRRYSLIRPLEKELNRNERTD